MLEFRTLASLLRPQEPLVEHDAAPALEAPQPPEPVDEEAVREIRLFRAHLREALDRAVEDLLERIAREVFARELVLAPGEIASLVDRTLERYAQAQPLRVRVHPDDVCVLEHCELAVFADESLERGDAQIDLRNGTLDLRLATRLENVIAKVNRG